MTRQITTREQAITFLLTEISLLDGHLNSVAIAEFGSSISLELVVTLRPESSVKTARLCFEDVEEYSFTNDEATAGNVIERFKAFKTEADQIYLSLDPYQEDMVVDSRDNMVVLARGLILEI